MLATILAEWNKRDYDQIIRRNTAELKHIVEALEGQGISVFFYELPLGPAFARLLIHDNVGSSVMVQAFGLERKSDGYHWNIHPMSFDGPMEPILL